MTEIVDGFKITRCWTQMGDDYFPKIEVEKELPGGEKLRNSIMLTAERFNSSKAAAAAVQKMGVLGVTTNGNRVAIKLDLI
jgi:hypothetical protein